VKRISLGSSLARLALGGLLRAGQEMRDHGTFGFARDAMPSAEANGLMRGKGA
jgi:2-methylisocitrate lyase-like PEP mutase family enzyme